MRHTLFIRLKSAVLFLSLIGCGPPGTLGNLCDQTDQVHFAAQMSSHSVDRQPLCDNHDFDNDDILAWADYSDWEIPQMGNYPPHPEGVILGCRSENYSAPRWTVSGMRDRLEWKESCRAYWESELERLCEAFANGETYQLFDYLSQEDQFEANCSANQRERYQEWRSETTT